MKTTFWGIVEIAGRILAILAGVGTYVVTKNVTTAIAVTTTVAAVVGISGGISSIKAADANPKITADKSATAKIP